MQSQEPSLHRRSVTFADREESFDLSKRTLELDLDEEDEKTFLEDSDGSGREATELSLKEKTESELDLNTEGTPSTPGELPQWGTAD